MNILRVLEKVGVNRGKYLAMAFVISWLGLAYQAQDVDTEATTASSELTGTVVTLNVGVLDQASQAYEIGAVPDGPPEGEPRFIDVGGHSVGLTLGVLDRDQQVVEVHLFLAAGEPLAQLLIEPDVTGYADLDEKTSLVVALGGIRQAKR